MATKDLTTQVGEDREVKVLDGTGSDTGKTVTLPGYIFDVRLNIPLIHQVVEAQRAAARQGTHATKTRSMVRGGGKKPWRQKGTGRARQGSIRAPQWAGGGVAHGPQPRDYSQRTPKKMIAGALRSALSDRARNEALFVLDGVVGGDFPSTKAAIATLKSITEEPRVLMVIDRDEDDSEIAAKSYSNIPGVHIIWSDQLNTYDVVDATIVVFTVEALNSYVARVAKAKGKVASLASVGNVDAQADHEDEVANEEANNAKEDGE